MFLADVPVQTDDLAGCAPPRAPQGRALASLHATPWHIIKTYRLNNPIRVVSFNTLQIRSLLQVFYNDMMAQEKIESTRVQRIAERSVQYRPAASTNRKTRQTDRPTDKTDKTQIQQGKSEKAESSDAPHRDIYKTHATDAEPRTIDYDTRRT